MKVWIKKTWIMLLIMVIGIVVIVAGFMPGVSYQIMVVDEVNKNNITIGISETIPEADETIVYTIIGDYIEVDGEMVEVDKCMIYVCAMCEIIDDECLKICDIDDCLRPTIIIETTPYVPKPNKTI